MEFINIFDIQKVTEMYQETFHHRDLLIHSVTKSYCECILPVIAEVQKNMEDAKGKLAVGKNDWQMTVAHQGGWVGKGSSELKVGIWRKHCTWASLSESWAQRKMLWLGVKCPLLSHIVNTCELVVV